MKSIKVRALFTGYYDDVLRSAGDVFTIKSAKEFSKLWMEHTDISAEDYAKQLAEEEKSLSEKAEMPARAPKGAPSRTHDATPSKEQADAKAEAEAGEEEESALSKIGKKVAAAVAPKKEEAKKADSKKDVL